MSDSVRAYDLSRRVAAYDSDMEIMHPLRSKMAGVLLEVLPWARSEPLRGVDLGVSKHSSVVAIDGAAAMLDLCRTRIQPDAGRVEFLVADFRNIPPDRLAPGSIDVVFSAYALHHLTRQEKAALIAQALVWLKPGGGRARRPEAFLTANTKMAGINGMRPFCRNQSISKRVDFPRRTPRTSVTLR